MSKSNSSVIEHPQTEREKVENWRLHVLIKEGRYPPPLAEKLASESYVDLHQAVDLVQDPRCTHEMAAEILL